MGEGFAEGGLYTRGPTGGRCVFPLNGCLISRVGFLSFKVVGRRDGFLPFDWLVAELLRREGGDYLPRPGSVGAGSTPLYNRSTPPALVQSVYVSKTADYELMKYLEDFQLTSGSRCVLYKGTGRTLFWCLREAKWSGEA